MSYLRSHPFCLCLVKPSELQRSTAPNFQKTRGPCKSHHLSGGQELRCATPRDALERRFAEAFAISSIAAVLQLDVPLRTGDGLSECREQECNFDIRRMITLYTQTVHSKDVMTKTAGDEARS